MQIRKVLGCFILATITIISACDNRPTKTDSMLYRESADSEANPLIEKATLLLSDTITESPEHHLDSLIVIKNTLAEIPLVYRKKILIMGKIHNWTPSMSSCIH